MSEREENLKHDGERGERSQAGWADSEDQRNPVTPADPAVVSDSAGNQGEGGARPDEHEG